MSEVATELKAVRLVGAVTIEAAASEGKPKRFTLTAYTGGSMLTSGFYHPVVVDLEGVSTNGKSRPIFRDHDERLIVGHTDSIEVSQQRIKATGVISGSGPHVDEVLSLAANSFPWQASIGAEVQQREFVEAGKSVKVNGRNFNGPLIVARKTVLKEVSFVPLGADDNTTASIAASRKDGDMSGTATTTAEQLRVEGITQLCGESNPALALQGVREGWSVEKTEVELMRRERDSAKLDALRAGRPSGPSIHATKGAPVLSTDTLSAALLQHAGKHELAAKSYGEQTATNARTLRVTSLVDACRLALKLEGRDEPVGGVNALLKAAFSTVSLPNALGDSASKSLVDAFRSYPQTWRSIARKTSNKDFHTASTIRPGAIRPLKPLPPDGEIKHDAPGEDVFTTKLQTFAGMLGISRVDIINDDLGFFDAIPAGLARAAAQAVNEQFATTWMLNGTHFTLARGNYFEGAGSELSATSLATAIKMLRNQTDDKGGAIDMTPTTLFVPPSLEFTAKQLVESVELLPPSADGGPTANPFGKTLAVVVEPRLENSLYSGFSATAWYLIAPPSESPALAAFLNGNESPTIERDDQPFHMMGEQWRAYLDVDFALGEYRAAIKSKGSA